MAREVLLGPIQRTTALVLDVMADNGLDAVAGDIEKPDNITS